MKNTPYPRYLLVGFGLGIIGILIIVQIIRIQLSPAAKELLDRGKLYQNYVTTMQPERGKIYDRWGNLLAGNKTVYEVGVDLQQVNSPQTIAALVSSVVGIDYSQALATASLPYRVDVPGQPNSVYAVLSDFVSEEHKNQLEAAVDSEIAQLKKSRQLGKESPKLSGLVWTPHLMRYYPEGGLASGLLGFFSRDGKAHYGVEERYNTLLAGTSLKVSIPVDPLLAQPYPDLPPGANLVLTIDRDIQLAVEEILDQAVKDTKSDSGTVVVMDPNNGEILAMASTPRVDLNYYWNVDPAMMSPNRFNQAVSQFYEPGSVFKVLTMSAALNEDKVKPDTTFLDTGEYTIGGVQIHNWDGGAWGEQTMVGCLQHSLNVCLSWVADQLGPTLFYKYLQSFGIGHLTNIDLAYEANYTLRLPGDSQWFEVDLGTNSFGQGVNVTPVQMVMATSAVANNQGKMMPPHVVRALINKGHQYDIQTNPVGSPIRAETAKTLSLMLETSLEKESSSALVEGYSLAGKTGTADIPTDTGYQSGLTNASFVGWGPVDDPRFLVYIWLEKPKTDRWGSVVAAPVFRDIVKQLVVLMDIPPDEVRHSLHGG